MKETNEDKKKYFMTFQLRLYCLNKLNSYYKLKNPGLIMYRHQINIAMGKYTTENYQRHWELGERTNQITLSSNLQQLRFYVYQIVIVLSMAVE